MIEHRAHGPAAAPRERSQRPWHGMDEIGRLEMSAYPAFETRDPAAEKNPSARAAISPERT